MPQHQSFQHRHHPNTAECNVHAVAQGSRKASHSLQNHQAGRAEADGARKQLQCGSSVGDTACE